MESLSLDEFCRIHKAKRVAVLGMLGDRESVTDVLLIDGVLYGIKVERLTTDQQIDEFLAYAGNGSEQ